MRVTHAHWTRATRLAAFAVAFAIAFLIAPVAHAQGWKSPTGSAQAARVSTGSGLLTVVASAALPDGGGIARAEQGLITAGALTGRTGTAVTSGDQSPEMLGVQSVATAADVSILAGRITAARVIAISMVTDQGKAATVNGDGSGISGLVIDGVPYDDESLAPNTRVELPGAGYVVLNERVAGRGRGVGLTVNMIHVYLNDGGEIVVASATSGNGK